MIQTWKQATLSSWSSQGPKLETVPPKKAKILSNWEGALRDLFAVQLISPESFLPAMCAHWRNQEEASRSDKARGVPYALILSSWVPRGCK